MDTGALLVLGIVVLLVVGVNGLLILAMRRGGGGASIRLFQKAAKRARNPWITEDEQLKELSDLVDNLKEHED